VSQFLIELLSVGPNDRIGLTPGDRLLLPRGSLLVGGVDSANIQCKGEGRGGRKCLTIETDSSGVLVHHLGRGLPIWHQGAPTYDVARLLPGDTFGPCQGIQFRLVRDDGNRVAPARRLRSAPGKGRLRSAQGMDRYGDASPVHGTSFWAFLPEIFDFCTVSMGVDPRDPDRRIVDLIEAPVDADMELALLLEARPHPAIAAVTGSFVRGDTRVWVRESTRGVALDALLATTQEQGARLDVEVACWITECVGRALLATPTSIEPGNIRLRFDDGQPLLWGPMRDRRFPWDVDPSPGAILARLLLACVDSADDLPPAVARCLQNTTAAPLVEALTSSRVHTGHELREHIRGLVEGAFSDACEAHRADVEEIQLFDEQTMAGQDGPLIRSRRIG
jgi:hypothetical protein